MGRIAIPLTMMLKKNNFFWIEESRAAFQQLKDAIMQAPILALPDFSTHFTIECDALGSDVRTVLMQKGKLLAFYIQTLKGRTQEMSTYENELFALV